MLQWAAAVQMLTWVAPWVQIHICRHQAEQSVLSSSKVCICTEGQLGTGRRLQCCGQYNRESTLMRCAGSRLCPFQASDSCQAASQTSHCLGTPATGQPL